MFLFLFAFFFPPCWCSFLGCHSLACLPLPPPCCCSPPPPSICPCPSTACVSFLFLFWLFFICWLLFPSVTCSSYAIPSCCAVSPCFINTTCSTLHQPPSWPLPAASMPWSPHPFVHGSMWVFFYYYFAFAHSCFIVTLCHVPSLMLCLFSCAMSPPSCHIHSLMPRPFSRAASSPPPVLHQPPFPWPIPAASTSWPLCTVSDASQCPSTAHCVLCMLCPHPLLRPCLTLCVCLCVFLCDCAPATLHVLGLDCRCD